MCGTIARGPHGPRGRLFDPGPLLVHGSDRRLRLDAAVDELAHHPLDGAAVDDLGGEREPAVLGAPALGGASGASIAARTASWVVGGSSPASSKRPFR